MKNKHESDRAREIALNNTVLRAQVGSGLHGVTVDGQDDRDEMGVCVEPPGCVIGLENFEQYQYRTQAEGERSGPGDLDLVIYSLRKWARLAAQGNPTVLLLLYVPEAEVVQRVHPAGYALDRDLFLSKDCGRRFLGYLEAQREQMLGLRSKRTNRPELIGVYGFDTKFAYHAIRLGIQGVELLSTGKITLPMPEPHRTWLRQLRVGAYTKEEALAAIDHYHDELEQLMAEVDLPDKVDQSKLNHWLTDTYQEWWETRGYLTKRNDLLMMRDNIH